MNDMKIEVLRKANGWKKEIENKSVKSSSKLFGEGTETKENLKRKTSLSYSI